MALRPGRRAHVTSTPPPATLRGRPQHHARALRLPTTARFTRCCASRTARLWISASSSQRVPIAGGYADAAAQDAFCANTYCWIAIIYDQSPKHNHLIQAPRGGFSGPAMGGFNNLPVADMAPITIMGHKAYGVFIEPGMGLRQNDAKGTAVDDQAEGQYWVINGQHYNSGCCFDYGNAEIDSRDDDNGTMETTYYGNASRLVSRQPARPLDHDRPGEQPGRLRQREMASQGLPRHCRTSPGAS